MPGLAETLSKLLARRVVDMTKLNGNYQVALEMSKEDERAYFTARAAALGITLDMPPDGVSGGRGDDAATASDPSGVPTIFKALEKLGLKLERRKVPVEMIVVDYLEKTPTDN